MKEQIFFRVEGNRRVGLGHFMRCVALAEMLSPYFKITFVGKEIPVNLLISRDKAFLKILEEHEFLEILNEKAIVVVDGYDFDAHYYKSLKATQATVVSIQDINHFSDNIDLVVNHLPDSEKFYPEIEILSGPKHAIIRSAFLELPKFKTQDSGEIFISLGGTENDKLVNKIIELLNLFSEKSVINVLTTEENKKKITGENVVLFSNIDANDIVQLIDRASVCLITSGMISYEVLARNKKAIVGALNEGQNSVGEYFKEMGLVEYLGYWKDLTKEKLHEALLMKNINQEKVKSIFDGKSGERISSKILSL